MWISWKIHFIREQNCRRNKLSCDIITNQSKAKAKKSIGQLFIFNVLLALPHECTLAPFYQPNGSRLLTDPHLYHIPWLYYTKCSLRIICQARLLFSICWKSLACAMYMFLKSVLLRLVNKPKMGRSQYFKNICV